MWTSQPWLSRLPHDKWPPLKSEITKALSRASCFQPAFLGLLGCKIFLHLPLSMCSLPIPHSLKPRDQVLQLENFLLVLPKALLVLELNYCALSLLGPQKPLSFTKSLQITKPLTRSFSFTPQQALPALWWSELSRQKEQSVSPAPGRPGSQGEREKGLTNLHCLPHSRRMTRNGSEPLKKPTKSVN